MLTRPIVRTFVALCLALFLTKILTTLYYQNIMITFFTSELQFRFKAKYSAHMCTMVLKETLHYHNSSNSTVFCMFLDTTKAFDS